MPNLKDLKNRIDSVKSTQKITSAMKMVAAAKLRRAQESAEGARPYAIRMERMLNSLSQSVGGSEGAPKLMRGTGSDNTHLLVAFTADRGLCGGFNGSIVRQVRSMAQELRAEGKAVKIFCIGRKGHDVLKREFPDDVVDYIEGLGRRSIEYQDAHRISQTIINLFETANFDICTIIFNQFQSAMTQIVTPQKIIPFEPEDDVIKEEDESAINDSAQAVYIFEPHEDEILAELLPRNMAVQIFQALLESSASEHGARMSAMDNATRNAGEMIDKLTLTYNRTRQAFITKELIEIISGAEAL